MFNWIMRYLEETANRRGFIARFLSGSTAMALSMLGMGGTRRGGRRSRLLRFVPQQTDLLR